MMYGTNWIQISGHMKNLKPSKCSEKARKLIKS